MRRNVNARTSSGPSLRDIYVARTVETAQPRFSNFLDLAGRQLGRIGMMNAPGSTHLTFIESAPSVKRQFRQQAYTARDVRSFSGELQQHLDSSYLEPDQTIEVFVDTERPLEWRGKHNDKLALSILLDDRLREEREHAVGFFATKFGTIPELKPFDPHITIGSVDRSSISPEARSNPGLLVAEGLTMPTRIVLNGLMVYLDNIRDS
jgi:hypothetical protein